MAPAVASALPTQSLMITPCGSCTPSTSSFHAGGDDSFTLNVTLDGGAGTPTHVSAALTPGFLSSIAANPSCLASVMHTSACQVGLGTVVGPGNAFNVYLVPPTSPATDVAGFDLVGGAGTGHAELSLSQITTGTNAGAVQGNLSLPISGSLFTSMTGLTVNVNGTLNGQPFERMPTSCTQSPATALTVNYSGSPFTENSNASPDVNVSSTCNSLPLAPSVAATGAKDSGDNGVALTTTISQTPGQTGLFTTTLFTPASTLSANAAALALQNTTTPVGSAVVRSPLLPASGIPGQVFLTGTGIIAPTLTVKFPAPFGLKLIGDVNLSNNSVVFARNASSGALNVPDVPVTSLTVALSGGPQALFTTSCAQPTNTLSAAVTGQNGKTANPQTTLAVTGCPPAAPTVSNKSLGGLGKKKPKLKFTLSKAAGGPSLKSFKVGLPKGLSFKSSKIKKGLKVSGGKVFSAKVSGGKLVVVMKGTTTTSVTVTVKSPALKVSNALAKKAKKHKDKTVNVKVTATPVLGASTTLTLTFNKPS